MYATRQNPLNRPFPTDACQIVLVKMTFGKDSLVLMN